MIIGIGTDIVETLRIEKSIEKNGKHFLDYVFTKVEQEYCSRKKNYESFAGRFAAKEAFVKAIGTGIGKEFGFKDIEIINDEYGKPLIKINKNSSMLSKKHKIHLSISHSKLYATAFVVIEILNEKD
ncbi:MAG: holo-ACP synthase [Candidatus Delongbacteria bacterium]|nr:holo-ACP synthase [Candidatus Delongbacteria bacterium]MBN2836516.1 holo-ACP synthase [Candidatus Delongbacteria bacterium]